ncbi:enhancer of yellow 2 transcription factor [Zopfochytrium polystomum]|nr:enhancer of yellow 2 transcription factor [Zopfochytrium polystomum]
MAQSPVLATSAAAATSPVSPDGKRLQRALIDQKLLKTGEKDKLKELLRSKLIEVGWRDEVKQHIKDVLKAKGLEQVTVDDLIAEVGPKARAIVPEHIKLEMLQRIRKALTDPE